MSVSGIFMSIVSDCGLIIVSGLVYSVVSGMLVWNGIEEYEELVTEKLIPARTVIITDSIRIMVINRCFVCNFGTNYAKKEVNMLIL